MKRRRNPSLNNPYGIDPEVYGEVVGTDDEPPIELVALAAITAFPSKGEVPKSFADAYERGNRNIAMAFKLKVPEGPWPGEFLRQVIVKWVINDSVPIPTTIWKISGWDKRLGVWCAAACAESVLRFVPEGEDRPRLAVEAAKGWVLGITGDADVRAAAFAASDARIGSTYVVASAAFSAASAAFSAASSAADAAAENAYAAADAAAYVFFDGSDRRTAESAILNIITKAIETYPVEQP